MLQQPIPPLQIQLFHHYPTSQQLNPSQQFSHPPPSVHFPPPLPVNMQNISIPQMASMTLPGCKVATTRDKENILDLNKNFNASTAPSTWLSSPDNKQTQDKCLYLKQLLQDKKQIQNVAGCFSHADRILDEEIVKVRSILFQNGDKRPLELPPPQGPTITLTEKIFVPAKDHPEYNFVGRILGPRGLTAKQLEQETKCKIMVRGKGSTRDKNKEDANRGKPNWEHLNEELHILITVEDSKNRAQLKMERAMDEIKKLLIPTEGDDELKKKQLMELAIINGTYKDSSTGQVRFIPVPPTLQGTSLPPSVPPPSSLGVFGSPTIARLPNGQTVISNGPVLPPPLLTCGDGSFLYYTPLEYPHSTIPLPEHNLIYPQATTGKTPLHM